MHMADWIAKLDDFLRLSDRDILTHAGKISHDDALQKAESEFAKFRQSQAALPESVDEHFEQTLDQLKNIESRIVKPGKKPAKKKTSKKKPKRKKRRDD